jgi:hypothetical protein
MAVKYTRAPTLHQQIMELVRPTFQYNLLLLILVVDFTLSIDLSTSWSTSNVTASPTPHNSAIPLNDMETRTPTMWYDAVSKSVRRFGGWPYNAPNPVAEYSFPVNNGIVSWTLDYTGGIGNSSTLPSFGGKTCPGYSLYASSPTTYYSLGGMMTGGTDPALAGLETNAVPLTGLLTYNNQEISWGNASSTAYGGTTFGGGQGFAIAGEGIYVPNFGTAGILVFLGGDAPTNQAIWTEGTSLVLMSEITIYDIGSAQFYTQVASGSTIPSGRTSFCAVGAPSADNATFEMYVFSLLSKSKFPNIHSFVYGGYRPNYPSNFGLENVYVLSLPAFEWFEAPAPNNTAEVSRAYHHCQVIGNRQMLSIGGLVNNNFTFTDPFHNGLGIFDMVDLTWGNTYNVKAAAYTRPTPVSNYYNGSIKYPSWNAAALSSVFASTATYSSAASTSSAPTVTPPAKKSTPTGAIAGGVVGGVVVLAVAAGLAFWYLRRRRQRYIPANVEDHQLEMENGQGFVPELGNTAHQRPVSGRYGESYASPKEIFPQEPPQAVEMQAEEINRSRVPEM